MRGDWLRGRSAVLTVSAISFVAILVFVHGAYITGHEVVVHDSLVASVNIGLFYDRLIAGDSWLWSSALNAGHPLWMDFETTPFLDPVAILVYVPAVAFGAVWQTAYQITAIVWLMIFSLGGAACTWRLLGDRWAAVLAGILLFAGPLAVLLPGQSWGYLVPFRYLTLILYLYLRLRGQVRGADIVYLGAALSVSLAGYQSAYLAVALLLLVLSDLAVNRLEFLAWARRVLRTRHAIAFGLPVLAALPLLAFLQYVQFFTVLPRSYHPDKVYFADLPRFLNHLFFLLGNGPESVNLERLWHDSTFIGVVASALLVHGAQRAVRRFFATKASEPETRWLAVLFVWFAGVAALAFGALGLAEFVQGQGSILGIRNFGFLRTCMILFLVIITAYGLREIAEGRIGLSDLAVNFLLFGLLASLHIGTGGLDDDDPLRLAGAVAVFVVVSLVVWRLPIAVKPVLAALTIVISIVVEALVLTPPSMPSLTRNLAVQTAGLGAEQILANRPKFGAAHEAFERHRSLERDLQADWPFSFMAPAVHRTAVARMTPLFVDAMWASTTSHFFRTRAYEAMVHDAAAAEFVPQVLGVERPVVELVPRAAVEDREGVLSFVLRAGGAAGTTQAPGSLRILAFEGSRLRVATEVEAEAVLIYRDNMAPGWTVSIDGREAELLVVDLVNKAVTLPAGRHDVTFVYRPWPYLAAFGLRLLGLLGAALACIWVVWHGRRRPTAPTSP